MCQLACRYKIIQAYYHRDVFVDNCVIHELSEIDNYTTHEFSDIQYIPRNMHTVFALLCFVVVIHWLNFPYPSGLLHWHCGNLTIAPVPAKQPWWIWINTSCEFIMNDCITTTKQSTTKPCAYFLGYTVGNCIIHEPSWMYDERLGPVSILRPYYLRMAISMLKIRRPLGRLIFNMGIAIPGKTVFLIETTPWYHRYEVFYLSDHMYFIWNGSTL